MPQEAMPLVMANCHQCESWLCTARSTRFAEDTTAFGLGGVMSWGRQNFRQSSRQNILCYPVDDVLAMMVVGLYIGSRESSTEEE